MTTLPNCLHCGGQATMHERESEFVAGPEAWIVCDSCGIQTATHDSPEEAEAAWRRRPDGSGELDEKALEAAHEAADAITSGGDWIRRKIPAAIRAYLASAPAPTVSGEATDAMIRAAWEAAPIHPTSHPISSFKPVVEAVLALLPSPTRAEVLEEAALRKAIETWPKAWEEYNIRRALSIAILTYLRALTGEKS